MAIIWLMMVNILIWLVVSTYPSEQIWVMQIHQQWWCNHRCEDHGEHCTESPRDTFPQPRLCCMAGVGRDERWSQSLAESLANRDAESHSGHNRSRNAGTHVADGADEQAGWTAAQGSVWLWSRRRLVANEAGDFTLNFNSSWPQWQEARQHPVGWHPPPWGWQARLDDEGPPGRESGER